MAWHLSPTPPASTGGPAWGVCCSGGWGSRQRADRADGFCSRWEMIRPSESGPQWRETLSMTPGNEREPQKSQAGRAVGQP